MALILHSRILVNNNNNKKALCKELHQVPLPHLNKSGKSNKRQIIKL